MICFLRRTETTRGKNWVYLQHLHTAEEPEIICKFEGLPEALRSRATKVFWKGAHRLMNEDTEFAGISLDDFFEEPVDSVS